MKYRNSSSNQISSQRYELKLLKFVKDKFQIKSFDTKLKKRQEYDFELSEKLGKVPTKYYSYAIVNDTDQVFMTGGYNLED